MKLLIHLTNMIEFVIIGKFFIMCQSIIYIVCISFKKNTNFKSIFVNNHTISIIGHRHGEGNWRFLNYPSSSRKDCMSNPK